MLRSLRTPLALTILSFLHERPMHPYEMKQLMRQRGIESSVRISGGALYSTIDRLIAADFIVVAHVGREGRRPERTTYALTSSGREEFMAWLEQLIAEPIQEYPWFGSAMTFIAHLTPDELHGLLAQRERRLVELVEHDAARWESGHLRHVPKLFRIEDEFSLAMRRAELAWVRRTIAEIDSGDLTWPDAVLTWQVGNRAGAGVSGPPALPND